MALNILDYKYLKSILGYFINIDDAALAYKNAAVIYHHDDFRRSA